MTPEEKKECCKKYYEANREKKKAHQKAYYEANKEKEKARRDLYYGANREEIAARRKAARAAKRDSQKDSEGRIIRQKDKKKKNWKEIFERVLQDSRLPIDYLNSKEDWHGSLSLKELSDILKSAESARDSLNALIQTMKDFGGVE